MGRLQDHPIYGKVAVARGRAILRMPRGQVCINGNMQREELEEQAGKVSQKQEERAQRHSSKKTLLIVEEGPGLWGAQVYWLRLAPLLEAEGLQLVLAAVRDGDFGQSWEASGRKFLPLTPLSERSLRSPGGEFSVRAVVVELANTVRRVVTLIRLVRRVNADGIIANSHWAHFECMLAGKLARKPSLMLIHERAEDAAGARLRSRVAGWSDRALAVSAALRDELIPSVRHNVVVVTNAIDVQAFSPGKADLAVRASLCADPKRPVVSVLSRLDPRKGIDLAIEAMAGVQEAVPGAQLAVVGSGALDPGWRRQLERLGAERLGDRVRFVGKRDDVADVLRASDVYLLASRQEGLPLGVLEAQATGVPVVAFATAGLPEIVEDGVTGVLVPEGDLEGLKDGVRRVLLDKKFVQSLVSQALDRVRTLHTLEIQANRVRDVLSDLTNS